MIDSLLHTLLSQASEQSLWCINESSPAIEQSSFAGHVICQRYDTFLHCQQHRLRSNFSDYDFSAIASNSLDTVIWRIAKEKAVNIHIIEQSLNKLREHGTLHLIGYRDEGIESLITLLQQRTQAHIEKHKLKKQLQHIIVHKSGTHDIENHYTESQWLSIDDFNFYSKPGVFGWQKIDKGSELLIHALQEIPITAQAQILDLGCGYGYLSLHAKMLGWQNIDATDNNAASILACQKNFEHYHIQGQVIADDCAQSIHKQYDLVLCNPPFHQGFDHKKSLTEQFCASAKARLKPNGQALFVVNQFIGLEKIAANLFKQQTLLAKEKGFKIILLQG